MMNKVVSRSIRDFFLIDLLGGEDYPNLVKSLKQKIANVGEIVNKQRVQIYNQKKVIKQAYQLVRRYERFIEQDISGGSSVAVNFAEINAVSIERIVTKDVNSNLPYTVIGYKLGGQAQLQEWFVHCNQTRHEQLVAEFRLYAQGNKVAAK